METFICGFNFFNRSMTVSRIIIVCRKFQIYDKIIDFSILIADFICLIDLKCKTISKIRLEFTGN